MSVNADELNCDITKGIENLAKSGIGEGHDNWLNGIIVQFDLTFSNKAMIEAERYHFLDFVSSQSTMHRIAKFNFRESCNEYVDERIIDIIEDKIREYNNLSDIIKMCEYVDNNIVEKQKNKYLEILYNTPSGFRLTAGMTTNYRQLKTIYAQRKNHRLPEWRDFCEWIELLPFSYLITGGSNGNEN